MSASRGNKTGREKASKTNHIQNGKTELAQIGSKNQPTAEQLRIAQLTSSDVEPEVTKKINQVSELTGRSKDDALTALHDCDYDANRAVEILLERQDDQTEEWQVSSKKKKAAVSAKGSQVGGGGESVGDSTASRSELVLTNDQDKSDHDRSGESVQRGRRERSGPPRFHRGRGYGSANGEKGGSSSRERAPYESGRGTRRRGIMGGGGRSHIGRGFSSGRGNFETTPHIDTWTNEKTVNGDKDVSIGDWAEDWGADEWSGSLEESRVFTASTSLANATIYNSMCTATTTAAESTGSIFDHSSLSTPAYVTGSTSATSHSTVTSVDSRASMLADSGSIYRPNAMPSGSLSSHSSLSSGYDLNALLQQQKLNESYEQSAAYLRYTQEATEVIKNAVGIGSASLGSHGSVGMEQMSHGLGSSSAMQNCTPTSVVKQPQRPRMPPPSRIPASAVEMPASMNSAQLDVQFGNWDVMPAAVSVSAESGSALSFTTDVASQQSHYGAPSHSMSQASSSLHAGSAMPGYDLSVTRGAAMMSVTVTEPSKSSLLMLDDIGMSGSASKPAAQTAYSNNANLSKDFINSKIGHGQPPVAFPSAPPDRKASPYASQSQQQPTASQAASHPPMTTQSPYSQVNTYVASTETISSSVYKATAVSTAATGAASYHPPSMNQYASSFNTYSGVDGSMSGHTTAATQYQYAGTAAPGFAPQPQLGGNTGAYGNVQTNQAVYGSAAHLNTSSKPYGTVNTTASDKQQSGMTYQSGGLSQNYDVYQQLNSGGQLATGSGTSSGSGYPLSGSGYQTYQGSSFQQSSVPAGYDLSATSQLSGNASYGSGHQYPPNLYPRQGRDNSVPAGSYTSGSDGYPRGTMTYSSTVPSSSIPTQSAASSANKLADGLGKLSVKDATSVTVSGQFDNVQMTNSSTPVSSLSTATTTVSSAGVGFLSAPVASSATARTASSALSTKSSVPLTSKAVVSMPVGGPAVMNNYMIAQPPGFQLAAFSYPPAQQPVTYTFEEVQMMQQPQRFPVPYYDVPFHQPVTTMTGRDVAASLTGHSYSAGGDTKLPAVDVMSPVAVQPAAVAAGQQQSNVAAAAAAAAAAAQVVGSATGGTQQQQQQQQSYLNPAAAMHPAAAAAPAGYSYYYPSAAGILPVGSYYTPMIQMGGLAAVPLATNPAHGVTTATTQYQKAAMYGSHAGYGIGGQTQDFTKTFVSSQTANKGPAAGMTNDVLTGAAGFNKTHVQAFDKGAFHSGTPPPPFNMALQSAAQTGAALGGGYGGPYMPMVPHQSHSTQILHHPMSQDGRTAVPPNAGQQPKAGGVNKTVAGYSTGYWGSN